MACNHFEQGRLSSSIAAHQTDPVFVADREIEAFKQCSFTKVNPDGQEMEHGAASSSFLGRETKKGHSEEWPFLTRRGCASVMPDVMFNVEQFMLDAFGLCQSIQASGIRDDFSVESIVFLDNVA